MQFNLKHILTAYINYIKLQYPNNEVWKTKINQATFTKWFNIVKKKDINIFVCFYTYLIKETTGIDLTLNVTNKTGESTVSELILYFLKEEQKEELNEIKEEISNTFPHGDHRINTISDNLNRNLKK